MQVFVLYNKASNCLLGVGTEAFSLGEGQEQLFTYRDSLPDFSKEYWNPALLQFQTKTELPISKKDFLKRFTPQEYSAIKAAALNNSTLDYYWQLFMSAGDVILSDPDTVAGVNLLEAVNLIGEGRAAEILT